MNLHENKELFADAVLAASQSKEDGGLGIKQIFIEKDYWISRSLKMLSQSRDVDLAVFKGGTSISKAYGLGSRFSEDIDVAITEDSFRTDSQTKALMSRISRTMSNGLTEVEMPDTRKFSKYRKVYYSYPMIKDANVLGAIKPGLIQLELVSFANPYPYRKVKIGSLLRDFLVQSGREDLVEKYGMEEFEVNVLDIKRTAADEESKLSDGDVVALAGIVQSRKIKYTKKNEEMAFITLEDLTGSLEVIVFPKDYEKNREILVEE